MQLVAYGLVLYESGSGLCISQHIQKQETRLVSPLRCIRTPHRTITVHSSNGADLLRVLDILAQCGQLEDVRPQALRRQF
eukprot:751395-Amphidinium_carterae.1